MWRLYENFVGGGSKQKTFRPVRNHKSTKQEEIHENTKKTLGSGNMREVVRLPCGEDRNEWFAANTVDFFNEISLIWGIVFETNLPIMQPGQGFPSGYEYRWADPAKGVRRCSAPEYIENVMTWIEDQINNEQIFPSTADVPFPTNFESAIKQIYTRIFRVYAIIYYHHFNCLEQLGAQSHLNTAFKHFMYFVWEFDLIKGQEFGAIDVIVTEVRRKYEALG